MDLRESFLPLFVSANHDHLLMNQVHSSLLMPPRDCRYHSFELVEKEEEEESNDLHPSLTGVANIGIYPTEVGG